MQNPEMSVVEARTKTTLPKMALNKRLAKKLVKILANQLKVNKNEDLILPIMDYNDTLADRIFGHSITWTVSRSEAFRLKLFLEDQLRNGMKENLIISRERLRRIPVVLKEVK
jgi:hypothetical protein